MPAKRARPYHHGDLRRALIEAAAGAAARERGVGFTVAGLARSLGVTHAAAYRHFEDRDALLVATATEGFRRLRAAQDRALSFAFDGNLPRLFALGRAHIAFALGEPGYYRIMFGHLARERRSPEFEAASWPTLEIVVATAAAAMGSGELPPSEVRRFGTVAWSTIHGIATLALDDRLAGLGIRTGKDVEALVDEAMQRLVR